ncbi:V-set and transmembrane domain-containing protein 5 [Pholidichthys leucotaenia]
MWRLRLWDVYNVAALLCVTSYMCHLARAISLHSPQRSLTRSVQDDVFFSVSLTCNGTPAIQWNFMSGLVSRTIGRWQPGIPPNITEDYRSRVQPYNNGSMVLSDLRLQDSGYYVITVMDRGGNSKDLGFVLKVNEVLYEDLQYLSISVVALTCMAGLLMLTMWLLDKAYRWIMVYRRRRQRPEHDETELERLDNAPEPPPPPVTATT